MDEIELTEEELDKIPNRHEIQDYLEEEGYLETKDGNLCQNATVEEIFSAGCEYILKKLKFDKMEKYNSHFINFEGLIAKGNDFKKFYGRKYYDNLKAATKAFEEFQTNPDYTKLELWQKNPAIKINQWIKGQINV